MEARQQMTAVPVHRGAAHADLKVLITIHEPGKPGLLARFGVTLPRQLLSLLRMRRTSIDDAGATDGDPISLDVLGEGSPAHNLPIPQAIAAWITARRARPKGKASSLGAYERTVQQLCSELGWKLVTDIDAESLAVLMSESVEQDRWRGTTANTNLTKLQAFSAWLAREGHVLSDPLAGMERFEDDAGGGARAATTEEARAMLRHGWLRSISDARASAESPLHLAMMLLGAMRHGEPMRIRRGQVHDDGRVMEIEWTPRTHKGGRREWRVVAPELAVLLRAHLGRTQGSETDPLLSEGLSPVTFRAWRERAGVPKVDRRGRAISTHSCRKWFETTLLEAGVEQGMIDYLMRHQTGVSSRYKDASPEAQLEILRKLPALWPERPDFSTDLSGTPCGEMPGPRKKAGTGLTPGHGVDNMNQPPAQPATGGRRRVTGGGMDRSRPESAGPLGPTDQTGNGHFQTESPPQGDVRGDLADLMLALGRLLQRGGCHAALPPIARPEDAPPPKLRLVGGTDHDQGQ